MKKNSNKTTDPNSVRLRLVNKKTGKLASSTNWLIDLAAEAKELGDSSGIAALLPQKRAEKLLVRNELKPFKMHKEGTVRGGGETSHKDLRVLVKLALPELTRYFILNKVKNHKKKKVNRKELVPWLSSELQKPMGGLNQHLMSIPAFHPLIEMKRGTDWWYKCLKNESKF